MHREQVDYINSVKDRHPKFFVNKSVLDVGSMDINGNNRIFFDNCNYVGLDIGEGKNVDVVCPIHEALFLFEFDTIISTEMLEHDKYWKESLKAMVDNLKRGGMLILTAAGYNRKEHGTTRTEPLSSPFTNDYYKNITEQMLIKGLDVYKTFKEFEIKTDMDGKDIYFFGVKN